MKQYEITGMHCAACSTRVEKAVSAVEGVRSCSVNLLTNSMAVEGEASSAMIIDAVVKAGYGASEKGNKKHAAQDDPFVDRETPKLKRRLIASLAFLLVLMYVISVTKSACFLHFSFPRISKSWLLIFLL